MDAGSSSLLELPQRSRQFTISEIKSATGDFDESLVIGRGGFGMVYKGTLTDDWRNDLVVAIKRLDSTSNQGAAEFWNEVQMLSKFRHRHLVSLIGYCNDGQEMILVYEFMPHGTLEDHLHKIQSPLSWVRRVKICLGAARGLHYLHTGTGIKHGIIHRDVKTSNILLDDSWAARISDFGLSKIGPLDRPSSSVNTFVKGTYGYLDPDYYATGRLTRKSDVYAFGVVLFEVLSGKRAVDSTLDSEHWGLVNWAQESIKEGRLKQIVDNSMSTERIVPKCLKEFGRFADRCLHSNPKRRPTMAEVVVCLESILALQEKANYTLHPAGTGMRIFGNKVPTFLSWSNGETSVGGKKRIIRFEFGTINAATDNFTENNKISRWGHGSMYKGRLKSGQQISIAEHDFDSEWQDFENEVALRVKLEHENLFKLIGYCTKGKQVFLVYEFALCESLDHVLFDPECTRLDWNKCNKIVLGVARVLLYLHRHDVIHGNVTPGNILLDENLHPKLSDFWLSRCLAINEADCVVESDADAIRETLGDDRRYLAPEYSTTGHLSTKADVFSFGVLIFEIISGHRMYEEVPPTDITLLEDVFRNWLEGTSSYIIDPRIHADSSSITRYIHIGLLCVQAYQADRPTMEEVVGMLTDSSSLTLPVPKIYMSHWMLEEYSCDIFSVQCRKNRILRRFKFGTIIVATENFSKHNKIPQICADAFMYKGRLQNGQGVSIAMYYSDSRQQGYKNEVSLLVKVEHENLLKLLGYSNEGTRVLLVYESALYASLDRLIDDPECTILDFDKRIKILLGVARALLYLHQHAPFRIIHCDVKPQNVLLDESLDPKLSNLGIARWLAINEADCLKLDTACGTPGYIAPEVLAFRLSTKADVYSFGVLILETMTGCTLHNYDNYYSIDNMSFTQYVLTNWFEGTLSNIIDHRIHADSSSITRVIHIGLSCVQVDPADRPTMEEVVGMLLTDSSYLTIPIPKEPISPWIKGNSSDVPEILQSSDHDSRAVEEFISELCPR